MSSQQHVSFPTVLLHFPTCLSASILFVLRSKNNPFEAEVAFLLVLHGCLDQTLGPQQGFWDIVYPHYNGNSHQAAINGDLAAHQIAKSICI